MTHRPCFYTQSMELSSQLIKSCQQILQKTYQGELKAIPEDKAMFREWLNGAKSDLLRSQKCYELICRGTTRDCWLLEGEK